MKRVLFIIMAACIALGVYAAPVELKVPIPANTPENKYRIDS